MKLIGSTQLSTSIDYTRIRTLIRDLFPSFFFVIGLWAFFSPISHADTVGVVTSISQPTGEIAINGRGFKLSTTTQVKIEGEKQLVDGRVENISVGKSISYREEGSVVRQITILKRPIDLPIVTPPNSAATVR
jgi:hypothetical protein